MKTLSTHTSSFQLLLLTLLCTSSLPPFKDIIIIKEYTFQPLTGSTCGGVQTLALQASKITQKIKHKKYPLKKDFKKSE